MCQFILFQIVSCCTNISLFHLLPVYLEVIERERERGGQWSVIEKY